MRTNRKHFSTCWFTQCAMAALASAAMGGAADFCLASGHGAPAAHAEQEAPPADNANSRGIELGEYQVRSYYPVQAQKSIVQFTLFATAPDERLPEMRHIAAARKHKIRDQVITVSRLVPLANFDEPELKSFRRRILLRLRRALPELKIEDVFVSEFQLKLQSL